MTSHFIPPPTEEEFKRFSDQIRWFEQGNWSQLIKQNKLDQTWQNYLTFLHWFDRA